MFVSRHAIFCGCDVCREEHEAFFKPLRNLRSQPNPGTTLDDSADAEAVGGRRDLHARQGSAYQPALLGLGAGTRTAQTLDIAAEVRTEAETTAASNVSSGCLQGLRSFFPGLCSSSSEISTEQLLSPEVGRVSVFRVGISRFLNVCDTCSPMAVFRRHASVVFPLMSQLCLDDATWWLLDSGASATVIAERYAKVYGVSAMCAGSGDDQFKAANGTPVRMSGRTEVDVQVLMQHPRNGTAGYRHATLKAMVGNIQHNIISTNTLCKSGWEFSQGRDWFEVSNKFSGEKVAEVGYFAGCPWMRVYPSIETQKRIEELESSNTFSLGSAGSCLGSGVVSPLTKADELSLQQHRLQGHVPHHPNCLQCAKGRSTFAHRRRKGEVTECELQCDFACTSPKGEELLSLLCSSMRCCGLGWVGGPLGLPTSRSSFGVFSVVHFSVAVFSCTLC